ncbi:hypothetical protein Pfo_031569 [Paulownia fortunei]|nr:hypothetical protein Pfo_031569 [Paulownia fortunei]
MYHIKGGKQVSATPANGRRGTVVTVRDLFYNTPARLKYLKRPQTELARIADIMNRIALSYANIAFTVTADGRNLLQTTGNGNQQQVVAAIYGRDVAQKMVEIGGEDDDFNVTGFISLPELTRGSRDYLTILINVNVSTSPLLIDVNVHPQKSEVRLSKETELADLIIKTIKDRLADENLIPDAYENLYGKPQETHQPAPKAKQLAPWTSSEKPPIVAPAKIDDEAVVAIRDKRQLTDSAVKSFAQKYQHEEGILVFDSEPVNQIAEEMPSYHAQMIADQQILDVAPKARVVFQN